LRLAWPARRADGGARGRQRRWVLWLRAFWDRAYKENVTGLSGMVAYNLMFALFPFALLVLFIFGQILRSPDAEASVLRDLQLLFPATEQETLTKILERIRDSSTTIGVAAAIGAVWVGTSFWGAMDTAFCRIYHVECRGWVEQKRFALGMLAVSTMFLAASVIVPTLEGVLASGARDLPFGLSNIRNVESLLLIGAALTATFALACLIYYFVPKGHMPWRAVWPGAAFVTVTMGAANYVFPFYLANVSSIGEFGGVIGFVLVALVWFYLTALALLAGAVINALRHELHDTGALPGVTE
jgi:YihY family inner membrane protein